MSRRTRDRSHHFALPQIRNLVGAEAELGEHLLGLLAELRRLRCHPARRPRQRDRLADQADVARLSSFGTSCAMQSSHLYDRIGFVLPDWLGLGSFRQTERWITAVLQQTLRIKFLGQVGPHWCLLTSCEERRWCSPSQSNQKIASYAVNTHKLKYDPACL
jgi:hypothetical protein